MGASQIGIYNIALRWLEERKLASLTENRESRRYMDDEYEGNIVYCLSQGNFNFSRRLVQIQAETTIAPNFGYEFAFHKPSDWNHTFQVSDNEAFNPLLRDYDDLNNYWYSNISPIYVCYISNDPDYGFNVGLWTPVFTEYVGVRLALLCAPRLKQAKDKVEDIRKAVKAAKAEAVSTDGQDLPPGRPPYGTWVQSRAPRGSITPLGAPFPGLED